MNEKERWLAGDDLEKEGLSPDEEVIHEQNKTIERLQEQLNEANKLIKDFYEMHEFNKSIIEYLKKWGVK